jgi:hypothetical protein
MDSRVIERLIASVEWHIADDHRHIALQHEIISRLEGAGLESCATTDLARGLLEQMETALDAHLVERERLRDYLLRHRAALRA